MADFIKNMAVPYDKITSWVIGDHVIQDKMLYECIAPTQGEFDEDCWEKKYITDYIGSSGNSNLGNKAELLWTNPNPTSNFNSQIISLDLSKYEATIVKNKVNISSVFFTYIYCLPDGNRYLLPGSIQSGNRTMREFVVNTTGINFQDAYITTGSVNNSTAIPLEIYGMTKKIELV